MIFIRNTNFIIFGVPQERFELLEIPIQYLKQHWSNTKQNVYIFKKNISKIISCSQNIFRIYRKCVIIVLFRKMKNVHEKIMFLHI